ncbi:MAG: membrane protein insertion efficiency factor YidD [Patescibacteria group bacterium]
MNLIHKILTFFPLLFIKIYQKTISLDHGWFSQLFPYGFCRFQPTCSHYGYSAIKKYGIIKGSFLSLYRIARCNPFSKGGFDPLK